MKGMVWTRMDQEGRGGMGRGRDWPGMVGCGQGGVGCGPGWVGCGPCARCRGIGAAWMLIVLLPAEQVTGRHGCELGGVWRDYRQRRRGNQWGLGQTECERWRLASGLLVQIHAVPRRSCAAQKGSTVPFYIENGWGGRAPGRSPARIVKCGGGSCGAGRRTAFVITHRANF